MPTAEHEHRSSQGARSPWAGDVIRNASLNNAIIAQHTLYPYHFVDGVGASSTSSASATWTCSPTTSRSAGGDLNVRRGDASQALYEARVKIVLERLAASGVQSGVGRGQGRAARAVTGIASERVIVILKEKMRARTTMAGAATRSAPAGCSFQ